MRAVLLTILICLAASSDASAMEALWGRVVSIDRLDRQMVVHARPMAAKHIGNDNDRAAPPGKALTVRFAADTDLPNCVAEGTVVRLWGTYSGKDSGVFNARYIRGAGKRFWGYDPTGVRQRIGMGRGKGTPGRKDEEHPRARPETQ